MACTTPPTRIPIPRPEKESEHSEDIEKEQEQKNVTDHVGRTNIGAILDEHPLTLYVLGRLTTLCLNHHTLHTAAVTLLDALPPQPAETALEQLHNRYSYINKAPYQRRSKKRALYDAFLRICPASWLGPTLIKQHDKHEYKRDRKRTKEVYTEFLEKRGRSVGGKSTSANSIVDLETYLAPLDCGAPSLDDEDDPWKLPPIEEIY
ncbi:hypothetical protein IMSHALPRED_001586 [Imshaugia aleurites]|uniref:Uncharacterized protein n=1 Tax=Imshaugia aleurites TaxID=172621 RepID=A0A8H3J2V8_9LECA|nr:hypothetical protein IMSHALPRED_001586 [Imshaugia aleurites]